jgi:UDP-N-acetylglucosamine--N-acetylmuramyl-(pentapeptide) pyrophosphoryl-undecaprenol N-acetylglucosamine transferase
VHAERPAAAQDEADANVLWVGSENGMERALVERAGLAYAGINTGQVTGVSPAKAAANVGRMTVGVRQSLRILNHFRPSVCLATGGYVCVPVVLACRMRGVPVMIYLPDMTPGSAIRSLSRLAQRVAVSFPEVAPHFGGEAPEGKAVVTGYPVRQELVDAAQDRNGARRRLAAMLEEGTLAADELPLVLVWGGSQGARSINQATWAALPALLPHAHVLHVIGTRDWPLYEAHVQALPLTEHAGRYHPVDYLHDAMPVALAAADLTVARAGASSLGEFPVAGLPSILVPLPHAGVNSKPTPIYWPHTARRWCWLTRPWAQNWRRRRSHCWPTEAACRPWPTRHRNSPFLTRPSGSPWRWRHCRKRQSCSRQLPDLYRTTCAKPRRRVWTSTP